MDESPTTTTYETPTITELGSIEEFTRGPGGGRIDNLFGISGGFRPPFRGFS